MLNAFSTCHPEPKPAIAFKASGDDCAEVRGLLRCCIRKPLLTTPAIPSNSNFPPLPPFLRVSKVLGLNVGSLKP